MIKLNIDDECPRSFVLTVDEPVRIAPFGQGGIVVYRGVELDENQQPALTYEPEHYQGVEEIIAPEEPATV